MKKTIIILLAIITPMISLAQLKVDSLGKVSINNNVGFNHSDFSVGGEGAIGVHSYFGSSEKTMWIENFGCETNGPDDQGIGLLVTGANFSYRGDIGILSSISGSGSSNGRAIGIMGKASGATSGYNYGVLGTIGSGTIGAGIVGYTGNTPNDIYVDGNYAGFFCGNIKATGTINGTVITGSDARLKTDIRELSDIKNYVLESIDKLNPISFHYIPIKETIIGDTVSIRFINRIDSVVQEKTHYGLIAQELKEIYPDLVYENDNGYLSINYTELIPVLIQSIKELKAQVDEMRNPNARKAKDIKETRDLETAVSNVAGMEQNVPNPFSGETDIAIFLPESTQTAMLYIYDLSGKQVEQHVIEGRGETVMTIHADKMDAGMYIYSLIADNKVVATKRMIVVR